MPIDLCSDTVTQPPPAMRAAMTQAEVGDDIFGDDPTVSCLEARVAEILGKEAPVFTPSGTMANLLAMQPADFPKIVSPWPGRDDRCCPRIARATAPSGVRDAHHPHFPTIIMKAPCQLALACLLVSSAHAEFRTWTRADGKTADLDLISVTTADGEKSGEFRMRNGRTVTLKQSILAEADSKLLADWKPAGVPVASPPSVFDRTLDGNLLKLQGKSLKACKDFAKPTKYYLFYYTASWCGPCHRFTPSLVTFYNKYKPDNPDFEVVLISADRDEKSMEGYAAEMNMPWPQLKLAKAGKFQQEFKHPGTGIPNLVLTDLQGNLIKTSYQGQTYLGPNAVMDHLETLLKK